GGADAAGADADTGDTCEGGEPEPRRGGRCHLRAGLTSAKEPCAVLPFTVALTMYPPAGSFAGDGGATAIPPPVVLVVPTRAVRVRAIVKWPLGPRAGALNLTIAPATGLP